MEKPDIDHIEGLSPGDFHRAEVDLAQSPFDGRHHHRDLRLPAPALCPGRLAALPGPSFSVGSADRQPDGRPGARLGQRQQDQRTALHAAGAGDPRTQGRTRPGIRAAARAGLCARARRWRAVRDRRGAGADPAPEAYDRSGGRSLQAARGSEAALRRILRDRAETRRRHGDRAVARRPQRSAAAVFLEIQLSGLRLLVAGARTSAVLVQLAGRRLLGLRRPGRKPVLRPGARGGASGTVARRGRGPRLGPSQRLLLPTHPVAGEALRFQRRYPLERT